MAGKTLSTPSVAANSSNTEVRIPGTARPHAVVVHPSPTQYVAVGWRSPIDGIVSVSARIADAHSCGNGVEWWVQHRTSRRVSNLGHGDFCVNGSAELAAKTVSVQAGEVIQIAIGPRQGKHSCDLTHVDMTITEPGSGRRVWDIAADISGNILEGNPLKDSHGNVGVWHFYSGNVADVTRVSSGSMTVPAGSLLASWGAETDAAKRTGLARRIEALATGTAPANPGSPDAMLFKHLRKNIGAAPLWQHAQINHAGRTVRETPAWLVGGHGGPNRAGAGDCRATHPCGVGRGADAGAFR